MVGCCDWIRVRPSLGSRHTCGRPFGTPQRVLVGYLDPQNVQRDDPKPLKAIILAYFEGPGRLIDSPRGSKYPIFEVSGSKTHTLNGCWSP